MPHKLLIYLRYKYYIIISIINSYFLIKLNKIFSPVYIDILILEWLYNLKGNTCIDINQDIKRNWPWLMFRLYLRSKVPSVHWVEWFFVSLKSSWWVIRYSNLDFDVMVLWFINRSKRNKEVTNVFYRNSLEIPTVYNK